MTSSDARSTHTFGSWKVSGLIASVAIAAMLLTGCASTPAAEPSPSLTAADPAVTAPPEGRSDLVEFYSQQPQWTSYADAYDTQGLSERIQTTAIAVPIDYDDPQLGSTEIVLYRQVAAEMSEGAIVMNPGGPGGGGEDLVLDADFIFEPAVLDTRDMVAFDPRGVYRSDPIVCRNDAELDESVATVPGTAEAIEVAAQLGQSCLQANPDLLAHVDTSNVARDLDVIRAVLGQPRLDYVGFSYGTEIGQRYLQLFPERAGRIVLDAPVAISLDFTEILSGQAEGFEANYRLFVSDYVASCDSGDNSCDLGSDPAQVRRSIENVVAKADTNPLPTEDGRTVSGAALASVVANSLYNDDDWAEVADALVAADSGDGDPALDLFDLYSGREPDGSYADNSIDAYYAISAADNPLSVSVDQVAAFAEQLTAVSPLFGESLAWELWQISNWPITPDPQEPASPTSFTGVPEVLVIGGANDPATPLVWAEATRDLLPGSALVVWQGVGHTATGTGSRCVDDIVTEFLLAGLLPADGTVCPA